MKLDDVAVGFKIAAWAALTLLLVSLTITVNSLRPKLTYTLENTNRAIRETSQTVANVRHATEEWEKSSHAQAHAATQTEEHAAQSLADLDGLIRRTDKNLNADILPKVSAAITLHSQELAGIEAKLGDLSTQLATSVAMTTDHTQQVLAESIKVMQTVAQQLADPNIPLTLANVADATKHLDGAIANLEGTTKTLEQYAERLTKPASMLKQVALGALQVGYQLRGLLGL